MIIEEARKPPEVPVAETSDTIVEQPTIIPNSTSTTTDAGQVLGESIEIKDEENLNGNWTKILISILILILIIIFLRRKIVWN